MTFVAGAVATDDDLAWDALERTLAVGGPPDRQIWAFTKGLGAADAGLDLRPHEQVIADGLTRSRLLFDYGRDYVTLSFMHPEDEGTVSEVIARAHENGLTAFDAQTRQIHRGDGHAGVTLKVEGRAYLVAPRWDQVAATVRDMTPDGGPSFLILSRGRHDYAQIAGGDGVFVMEWREYNAYGFKHWTAGYHEEPNTGRVSILTNGFHVPVRRNENMSLGDVEILLLAFLADTGRPDAYHWRDMTDEFS